jgi:Aspartyl protease/Tetratricopeptide repeat
MSSRLALIIMALTSFLAQKSVPVVELLLKDQVAEAEAQLNKEAPTAGTIALRGEIEYRKGNLDQAASLYQQALKMDPKTARAHFGLGKLAMAKLKDKEAVQEIARAIELEPSEPLYRLYASEAYAIQKNYAEQMKQLQEYIRMNPNDPDRLAEAKAGYDVLRALGAKDIGVVVAPQSPAPIQFRKSLNLIFTSVMINGKGPYEFAIDTGASQVVLSEKLAVQLGLKPLTSTVMHGVGGGGKIDTKLYSVDEISVGDVKIKKVPVGTFNDPLVTQLADGILGTALLSDFILTVNYPASQLELARKRVPNAPGEAVPAWFFSNLLLVPLDVNGKHGNFVVDTGAVTTVLSHSMAANLGVTPNTPGAKVDLGLSGVGGFEGIVLKVPNVTLKTPKNSEVFPQVVSIDLKEISKMIGTEIAGVVGFDFLEGYKVTLDYYAAEVRLAK